MMSLGVWYTVHRTRRSAMEIDEHLVFEDSPAADFESLTCGRKPRSALQSALKELAGPSQTIFRTFLFNPDIFALSLSAV